MQRKHSAFRLGGRTVRVTPDDGGYVVTVDGLVVGRLVMAKEASQRVGFRISADRRKDSQVWRGVENAARALATAAIAAIAARDATDLEDAVAHVYATWDKRPTTGPRRGEA